MNVCFDSCHKTCDQLDWGVSLLLSSFFLQYTQSGLNRQLNEDMSNQINNFESKYSELESRNDKLTTLNNSLKQNFINFKKQEKEEFKKQEKEMTDHIVNLEKEMNERDNTIKQLGDEVAELNQSKNSLAQSMQNYESEISQRETTCLVKQKINLFGVCLFFCAC